MVSRSIRGVLTLLLLAASAAGCHLHWRTVDVLTPAGDSAVPLGMAATRDAIFTVGLDRGADGNPFWTTRRSTNRGGTWQTIESGLAGYHASSAEGAAASPDGTLYVVGMGVKQTELGELPPHWIVRRSTDDGISWTTVEDISEQGSFRGMAARSAAVAPDGTVYVVGNGWLPRSGSGSSLSWVVRRSADRGATWVEVNRLDLDADGVYANPFAVATGPDGHVYVAGEVRPNLAVGSLWVVMHSVDGVSWGIADQYRLEFGAQAEARAIGVAPDGGVFAAGLALSGSGSAPQSHWIVRRAAPGSSTAWSTVDDFIPGYGGAIPTAPRGASPTAIAISGAGGVFVSGLGAVTVPGPTPGSTRTESYAITRMAPLPSGAFSDSDVFRHPTIMVGFSKSGGATSNRFGEVFASQPYAASPGASKISWNTRRLSTLH